MNGILGLGKQLWKLKVYVTCNRLGMMFSSVSSINPLVSATSVC